MISLKYKTIEYKDLVIYMAKSRRNRSIRISIDGDSKISVTSPYYVNEAEVIDFIQKKEPWIRKVLVKQQNLIKLGDDKGPTRLEKKLLLEKIMSYVHKYELLMNTKVEKVSLRKMRTMWGSCSYKERTIRFNTKLFYMSDNYIEYVVVHEMAHIFVPNHQKAFYDIVSRYLPNYKTIRKEAKSVRL